MKPVCVFFDLDNTLVDRPASMTEYAGCFAQDFADRLEDVAVKDLADQISEYDGGGYNPKEEMFSNIASGLPWATRPDVTEIEEHWFSVFPKCTKGKAGFRQILHDVHSREMSTGLITNGKSKSQDAKIDLLDIRALLDVIVISEAVDCWKPDPGIFQIAMDKAGTTPEETWFVGDNPIADVKGARDLAITAVWITGSHDWPESEPPPTYEIDELEQLNLLLDIAAGGAP